MKTGHLFDASALLNTIRRLGDKASGVLVDASILDLTVYEAGNGVWKMVNLFKSMSCDEGLKVLETLGELLPYVGRISLDEELTGAYEVAVDENITFYDAAYVAAAKDKGLTLVTDDLKLLEVAKKYVKVTFSDRLLK